MAVLVWIVLGIVAGFIGSKFVKKNEVDPVIDVGLGVLGAIIGGSLFNLLDSSTAAWLNIYSLLGAVVGAVALLFLYRMVVRRA